jgi:hypothetical protein
MTPGLRKLALTLHAIASAGWLGAALTGHAVWFVVLGIVLHGWWWRALDAICWIGLAALLGYAVYAYATERL